MEKIRELIRRMKDKENTIDPDTRKRIRMQILILIASILLVVVLVFAMTAAWFTNIAKTSDLVFQTESWGFDADKITVGDEKVTNYSIPIAPGTSGIIPLSIDNSEEAEAVQIGVTISKTGVTTDASNNETPKMNEELQKRIFFYADIPKTYTYTEKESDGTETTTSETTSRIYLGSAAPNNYTYTILPGQKLTMSDLYYNDVPIKWEWVYDMLGYYFVGTVVGDKTEGETVSKGSASVEEYIRPIEYDYEQAVFDRDTGSETYRQLLAVGNVSVKEYLKQLSLTDGYKGTIGDPVSIATTYEQEETLLFDYYPVEVDENGYGVWAYLCNFDEVVAGMNYDTALANQTTDPVTATATIVLTANNVSAETKSVTDESSLLTALADNSIDIVELGSGIELSNALSFTEGSKVLNLNGYSLTYDGTETEYNVISVSNGATLTVMNGQIVESDPAQGISTKFHSKAFDVTAGNLILSDVEVEGVDCAVYVQDMSSQTGDSVIQITNCDLKTTQATIALQGNGSATDATTKMMIQNSNIYSEYYVGITGQGNSSENDQRWGTELVLADSTVYGYYVGIYQPQQKSLTTINNCKISGLTGITVKGGTVNIYDSTITGKGTKDEIADAVVAKSGSTDTGDGVYVEAGYNWSATVTLKGENTKVVSDNAYAVEMVGESGKGPGKIIIYDGTYEGTKGSANWDGIGTFEIYGGTFSSTVNESITKYDVTATPSEE